MFDDLNYHIYIYPYRDQVISRPQVPADNAPRAPLITASDTLVDFKNMTSADIHGRFRALSHQVCFSTPFSSIAGNLTVIYAETTRGA